MFYMQDDGGWSVTDSNKRLIDMSTETLKEYEAYLLEMTDGIRKTSPSNREILHRIRNDFSHKEI